MQPNIRILSALWWAMFLVSLPFGILAFVLPIYGKELGGSALEMEDCSPRLPSYPFSYDRFWVLRWIAGGGVLFCCWGWAAM